MLLVSEPLIVNASVPPMMPEKVSLLPTLALLGIVLGPPLARTVALPVLLPMLSVLVPSAALLAMARVPDATVVLPAWVLTLLSVVA